jgi:hypothetical protein
MDEEYSITPTFLNQLRIINVSNPKINIEIINPLSLTDDIQLKMINLSYSNNTCTAVCKYWYKLISSITIWSDGLTKYIEEKNYYAIHNIYNTFRYKFLELDVICSAISENDTYVLKIILKIIYAGCNRTITLSYKEHLDLIFTGIMERQNHIILEYFIGYGLDSYPYKQINRETNILAKCSLWKFRVLNIIGKVYDRLPGSDFRPDNYHKYVAQLAELYDNFVEKTGLNFGLSRRLTDNEAAFFQCERHGLYYISNNIPQLKIIANENKYSYLYPLLRFTGLYEYIIHENPNTFINYNLIRLGTISDSSKHDLEAIHSNLPSYITNLPKFNKAMNILKNQSVQY